MRPSRRPGSHHIIFTKPVVDMKGGRTFGASQSDREHTRCSLTVVEIHTGVLPMARITLVCFQCYNDSFMESPMCTVPLKTPFTESDVLRDNSITSHIKGSSPLLLSNRLNYVQTATWMTYSGCPLATR